MTQIDIAQIQNFNQEVLKVFQDYLITGNIGTGMNAYFIENVNLLTGQSAPFTGAWNESSLSRNTLFTVYSNGGGTVDLQYKSPFFENEGVTFYSITGISSGYQQPAFLESPMTHIRALCSGSGNFWVSAIQRN